MTFRWPKRAVPVAAVVVVLGAIPLVAVGSTIYFVGHSVLRFVFRRRHEE